MPLLHDNWVDLIDVLEKNLTNQVDLTAFAFRNTYFMDRFMDNGEYARRGFDQVLALTSVVYYVELNYSHAELILGGAFLHAHAETFSA